MPLQIKAQTKSLWCVREFVKESLETKKEATGSCSKMQVFRNVQSKSFWRKSFLESCNLFWSCSYFQNQFIHRCLALRTMSFRNSSSQEGLSGRLLNKTSNCSASKFFSYKFKQVKFQIKFGKRYVSKWKILRALVH